MSRFNWFDAMAEQSIGSGRSITDKDDIRGIILSSMYQMTNSMFEYKGMPEEIPVWQLELFTQSNGFTLLKGLGGKYYDFIGGLGGKPNWFYFPTIGTVANPALNYSAELEIGKDCVLFKNDQFCEGLGPWNNLYASMIAEGYCTLRICLINARAENIITVNDDNEAEGAEAFLSKLIEGKEIGHLVHDGFMDTDSSIPYSNASKDGIRSAVEAIQYLYAEWAQGVGLQASFNTKREYVSSEETNMGVEMVVPRVDQMLECRKEAIAEFNRMYGLNVSVDYGSAWKKRQEEEKLEREMTESQSQPEKEVKEDGTDESEKSVQ